jgi:hypothetical protein
MLLRLALAAMAFLIGLAIPASARADFERCCLRIEVQASGQYVQKEQELTWSWTLRQVGRYVQHGRIFNAITGIEGIGFGSVIRGEFEARGPVCHRRLAIGDFAPSSAYASLEDSASSGRIALVVRAESAGRSVRRCAPDVEVPSRLGGPWEYELDPPPGSSLRHGGSFSVARARGTESGVSAIRVRFTYIPRPELEDELARLSGEPARYRPGLERAE